jgi:hypothetical protein
VLIGSTEIIGVQILFCVLMLNRREVIMLLRIVMIESVFVSVDDVMKARENSANSHCLFSKNGSIVFVLWSI